MRKMTVIPQTATSHKTTRVAAYCRVSTDKSDQKHSFEVQQAYFQQCFANSADCELVGIYSDSSSATSTANRSGFQQLINDCRSGKIDRIVSKSISRFARNTGECLTVLRELKKLGVTVLFEKEGIDTEYGVSGMVNEKKAKYEPRFTLSIIIGVVLFILSFVPTIIIESLMGETALTEALEPSLFLGLIAIGVGVIVRSSTSMNGYRKLLEEDGFNREEKAKGHAPNPAIIVYWCVVTALYLSISFLTNRWDMTWLIWVIAAVLNPVVVILFPNKKN